VSELGRDAGVCSRRRHPTPTDVAPPPPPPPGRCWSGPSLRSLGVPADRDEPPTTPPRPPDTDADGAEPGAGGVGPGAGDVELLPKPSHRGYGSLQKVYPARTTHDVDRLRLLDAAVDVFVDCVAGTRDQTRMNSQTFRTFVRSVRVASPARMHPPPTVYLINSELHKIHRVPDK